VTSVEPPTRSAFDNGKCHVMAFRPISEAAHSWSYDNSELDLSSSSSAIFELRLLCKSETAICKMLRLQSAAYDECAAVPTHRCVTVAKNKTRDKPVIQETPS